VLEALWNAGEEEHGQNRGVLPVNQADNLAARVERPRHDDVVALKVWMAYAKVTESRVPRDE